MISDHLHLCKDLLIVFINNILQNIVKPQDHNTNKLHLYSDGPNKQFKNKVFSAGLHWLESRFKSSIGWNFLPHRTVKIQLMQLLTLSNG